MKIYLTYDRYEHNEWFRICSIDKTMVSLKKHYKDDLVDFISYGPDDCHSYQIQIVDLNDEQYKSLMSVGYGTIDEYDNPNEYRLMSDIYERLDIQDDNSCLLFTDGCSDNDEVIEFYCEEQGMDPDDEDDLELCSDKLSSDEELYDTTLRKYIDSTY